MKTCAVCGSSCEDVVLFCSACGEASWCAPATAPLDPSPPPTPADAVIADAVVPDATAPVQRGRPKGRPPAPVAPALPS